MACVAPLTIPSLARSLTVGFGAVTAAVTVGALLYLLVSFVAMRRHTPDRPLLETLRAMAAEAWAIAITQPLIPLGYLVGRRLGGPTDGRPVIFVHGYFQNRADFVFIAHVARRAGLGPLYGFNYNWLASVPSSAARLAAFVERVATETGKPSVALVAHSLGGVVSLEYLSTPAGAARVDRCVTIASPHAGVQWRGVMIGVGARQLEATSDYMTASASRPLPLRALSVYSTHDNIVHPKDTSTLAHRGGEDVEFEGVGHLSILFSREVADAVVAHLSA